MNIHRIYMYKILYTKYKRGFLVHFFQKMVNFKYAKKPYISMVCGVFWCYVFLIHGFIHYFWKLDKHTGLCIIIQTVSAIYNVAFFVPTFWFFTMYTIYFLVPYSKFHANYFYHKLTAIIFLKNTKKNTRSIRYKHWILNDFLRTYVSSFLAIPQYL